MPARSRWPALILTLLSAGCQGSPVENDAVLASAAAPGPPPYLPGEKQDSIYASRGTLSIGAPGAGQQLVQTFASPTNGWLGYLELPVGCGAGVLLNVMIRDGLGGPVLFEGNAAGLPTVVGSFQLIQVFDPAVSPHGIRIHKNHQYAFELAAFVPPGVTENQCGIARGPAFDVYPRGRAYFQDVVNGPGFLPLPNGLASDEEDLPFITLMR